MSRHHPILDERAPMPRQGLYVRAFLSSAGKVLWDLLGRGLSFALSIIVARSLGAAGFGRYAVLWYLAWMTAQLTDLGLHLVVLRNLSGGNGGLPTALRLKGVSSLVALSLAVAGPALAGEYRAVLPLCGAALAGSWCELFGVCLRSRGKIALEGMVLFALRAGWLAAAVAVLMQRGGVFELGLGLLAGSAPALVLGLVLVARQEWAAVEGARRDARSLLAQVAPLAATAVITLLYLRVDVLLLARFRGDEEAGLFAASFRLVEALFLFSGGIVAGSFPLIAARVSGARTELARLSRFVCGLLLSIAVPAAAGFVMLAEPIVELLYGSSFARSAPSLRLLALALVAIYVNALTTHLLVATRRGRALVTVMLVRLVVGLGIDLLLIPSMGSLGAAIAVVVAEWSLMVLSLAVTRQWLTPSDLARMVTAPVVCSLLMAIIVLLWPAELLFRVALGASIYGGAILLLWRAGPAREVRALSWTRG